MNEYNNLDTLEHYSGNVWITKGIREKGGGNVCYFHEGKKDFIVIAHLDKEQVETLDESIKKWVIAAGTANIKLERGA
ncbi:MAG: hypothetical protein NC548_64470 [Lachnospiraceae bacterium]|nr:hypothetical protein [Lachnospiraceae bacterium]